jgi:ribosomal protein S18 acetylase RimI-like enzyme
MNNDSLRQDSHFSLRRAVPEDAPRIAVLGTYVWLGTYANEGVSHVIADYLLEAFTPDVCRDRIQDPSSVVLVAEAATNLVGFLVLRYDNLYADATTEVEILYVQPSYAGSGIGTALLAAARDLAQERTGNPMFWLTVNSRNDRAIRFYRSLGLAEEGKTYFELGGTRHENLVMVSRMTWRERSV